MVMQPENVCWLYLIYSRVSTKKWNKNKSAVMSARKCTERLAGCGAARGPWFHCLSNSYARVCEKRIQLFAHASVKEWCNFGVTHISHGGNGTVCGRGAIRLQFRQRRGAPRRKWEWYTKQVGIRDAVGVLTRRGGTLAQRRSQPASERERYKR